RLDPLPHRGRPSERGSVGQRGACSRAARGCASARHAGRHRSWLAPPRRAPGVDPRLRQHAALALRAAQARMVGCAQGHPCPMARSGERDRASARSVQGDSTASRADGRVCPSRSRFRATGPSLADGPGPAACNGRQGGGAVSASRLVRLASLALLLASTPGLAQVTCPAGANTWTGSGGNTDWFTAGNWSLGTPVDGPNICFNSAATPNLSSSFIANSLTFLAAASVTITSDPFVTLEVDAGGISRAAGGSFNIAPEVLFLGASQPWVFEAGGNSLF